MKRKSLLCALLILANVGWSKNAMADTEVHYERIYNSPYYEKKRQNEAIEKRRKQEAIREEAERKQKLERQKEQEAIRAEEQKQKEQEKQETIREEAERKQKLERKKEQEVIRAEEQKQKEQEKQETIREEVERKQKLERQKEQETIRAEKTKEQDNNKVNNVNDDFLSKNASETKKDVVIQYNYMEVPLSRFANMPSRQEKIKKLCKNVRMMNDEMANKTYYSPKRIYADPIALYPYISINNDTNVVQLIYSSVYMGTYSRSSFRGITVQMGKANFINYHTVRILADNKLYEMYCDPRKKYSNIETSSPMIQGGIFGHNNSISAVESYNEVMDRNDFEIFKAIVKAKNVKMRFIGNNAYVDKKMKNKLKSIHEEIFAIFSLLTE